MMVLIVDEANKPDFVQAMREHPKITFKTENFQDLDFTHYKVIFDHDGFIHPLNPDIKQDIVLVGFTGSGQYSNKVFDDADGYKFRATIESPSQVNTILQIIDKDEFNRDDLDLILDHDPELEALLLPFAHLSPFDTGMAAKGAKTALNNHIKGDSVA